VLYELCGNKKISVAAFYEKNGMLNFKIWLSFLSSVGGNPTISYE
jgi:hypothetical protein